MKTYQQLADAFMYGAIPPVPPYVDATCSPKLAFEYGYAAAKDALRAAVKKERGIEAAPTSQK